MNLLLALYLALASLVGPAPLDDGVVCHLSIPAVGLETDIVEMYAEDVLDSSPAHWPETPLPGNGGSCVISGHRSTHGSPFLRLGELRAGDVIVARTGEGEFYYSVRDVLIVGWHDTYVVSYRGKEQLCLTTCNPIGKTENVLVVIADRKKPEVTTTTEAQTPTTIGSAIMCDENGVVYEWRDGGWQPTGDTAW